MELVGQVVTSKKVAVYGIPGMIRRHITPLDIDQLVAEHWGIAVADMSKHTRRREVVAPRQMAMYFQKTYTRQSLSEIGRRYGNKDHSTVLHACRTVENLFDTDMKYRHFFEEVQASIEYFRKMLPPAKLKK